MDLSDIKLIKTIADAGSISLASQRLNLSQPTVSKRLARLEHTLKMQLFHRLPRGMTPTATAELSCASARPEPADAGHHSPVTDGRSRCGPPALGVGPIIEQVLLPHVPPELLSLTGGAQITVVTENDRNLIEQFAASELDVIVGPFDQSDTTLDALIELPMLSEPMIAAVGTQHPLFTKTEVSLDDAVAISGLHRAPPPIPPKLLRLPCYPK